MPRLTETDLAAIKARERAATKGPWIWGRNSANGMPALLTAHKAFTEEARYYGADCVLSAGWMADISGKEADQVFIAEARQDVPALLAEVRRLRQALHMIATIASDDGCSDAYVSRAALVAAIEALKDAEPSHGLQSVHYSSGQMGQQRLHAAKEDPS